MVASYLFAEPIVNAFINEPETIRLGTEFLKARCFAMPFMIVGFQIVNFMQAVNQGKMSFLLTIIRHLLLNIPALVIMNMIWGMTGLIWVQTVSDVLNLLWISSFPVHLFPMKNSPFPMLQSCPMMNLSHDIRQDIAI